MGLFDLFRKKEALPEKDRKWNLMWDLWVQGRVESPYAELMEYDSQVNNGGHSQYFFNVANCGDLAGAAQALLTALPEPLLENFRKAYKAFSGQEDICDDENDDLFDECDNVFYQHEKMLLEILEGYSGSLTL